ncbi:enoyl-[acyl-carrier-protein] reductase [Caballeronia insecticola]|uniref:Enoyl-[acyl-carrier-protein] reductase n=1 Tax=Caballeronia insecticola TaxID=758793 RepID=R4X287_9BURK|nr:enoyl-[acyl-carrier-protein] reductase [Caballeronia insecticola]
MLNCSARGFARAMDISCHSFVRVARLAAPLGERVDIMNVGFSCARRI